MHEESRSKIIKQSAKPMKKYTFLKSTNNVDFNYKIIAQK